MSKKDLIYNIIQSNKWVKNDIAMGRVICSKLVATNSEPELMVFITSNQLKKPLVTYIEQVLVVEDELILFYDGQYPFEIDVDEYDRYKDNLSLEEWNLLFKENPTYWLVNGDYILKDKGYYLEIHETMEKFLRRGINEEESKEIKEEFNLKS